MSLAFFYGCTYVAALAALTAFQFGWRPVFVALWDSRANVYFQGMCFFAALAAVVGLVIQAPLEKLSRPVRSVLSSLAIFITLFAGQGIVELSPLLSREEIIEKFWETLGIGVGIGLFAGLISSVVPESQADKKELAKRHSRRFAPLAILAAVLVSGLALLLYPRARDDVSIRDFDQVSNAGGRLEIGVNEGGIESHEFAIIRVTERGKVNSLVLERDEWDNVVDLWKKAQAQRSNDWVVIGATHDTTPPDPSKLVLLAGRGVRFVVSSPHGPTVRFDLDRRDFQRFDAACKRVEQTIAGA